MVDRFADNKTQIDAALALSDPGDRVLVNNVGPFDGNFVRQQFAGEVTVKAADPDNRPNFGFTRIQACDRLAFEQIRFDLTPEIYGDGGAVCLVQRDEFSTPSNRIRLEECHSQGRDKCFFIDQGTEHQIIANTTDRVGQGAFTIQSVTNSLIARNTCLGLYFLTPEESHGDFIQASGNCSGNTYRQNYLPEVWTFDNMGTGPVITSVAGSGVVTVETGSDLNFLTGERIAILDPAGLKADGFGWFRPTVTGVRTFEVVYAGSDQANWVGLQAIRDSGSIVQGYFNSNGVFQNITYEGNLAHTNAVLGIGDQPGTITSSGHILRDNTILNNGNGNNTQIGLVGTVTSERNVAEVGGQIFVQGDDPGAADYIEDFYLSPRSGDGKKGGIVMADFAIVPGSAAETNGAREIINLVLGASMPIQSTDIVLRLSGGAANTDPAASIGGAKSSSEITTGQLSNLFDQVSAVEGRDGDVEYRCVYVQNDHPTLTFIGATASISQNTPSGSTEVAIGVGSSPVNGSEPSISDEDTAPAGVSFSDGTAPLALGDIPPGQHRAIWFRWTVDPATPALALDNVVADMVGGTAA